MQLEASAAQVSEIEHDKLPAFAAVFDHVLLFIIRNPFQSETWFRLILLTKNTFQVVRETL